MASVETGLRDLSKSTTVESPSDPHHLRFAQPRAIGLKVSDEFTVPLYRGHHRELHRVGSEAVWWQDWRIDPLKIAKILWDQTHPKPTPGAEHQQQVSPSPTQDHFDPE